MGFFGLCVVGMIARILLSITCVHAIDVSMEAPVGISWRHQVTEADLDGDRVGLYEDKSGRPWVIPLICGAIGIVMVCAIIVKVACNDPSKEPKKAITAENEELVKSKYVVITKEKNSAELPYEMLSMLPLKNKSMAAKSINMKGPAAKSMAPQSVVIKVVRKTKISKKTKTKRSARKLQKLSKRAITVKKQNVLAEKTEKTANVTLSTKSSKQVSSKTVSNKTTTDPFLYDAMQSAHSITEEQKPYKSPSTQSDGK